MSYLKIFYKVWLLIQYNNTQFSQWILKWPQQFQKFLKGKKRFTYIQITDMYIVQITLYFKSSLVHMKVKFKNRKIFKNDILTCIRTLIVPWESGLGFLHVCTTFNMLCEENCNFTRIPWKFKMKFELLKFFEYYLECRI